MISEEATLILRELDGIRSDNRSDHDEMKGGIKHTNGTVAELVEWKIKVKTVLWIFGALITFVVVPVLVYVIEQVITEQIIK